MTDPVREALRDLLDALDAEAKAEAAEMNARDNYAGDVSAYVDRLHDAHIAVIEQLRKSRAALAAPAPDAFARGRASGIEEAARAVAQWSPASANTDAWLRERDLVAAAIRALAPQPAQDGWQPIETAPDGYDRERQCFNRVLFRGISKARSFDHAAHVEGWMDSDRKPVHNYSYALIITHWRPLPAPPAPAKGEG